MALGDLLSTLERALSLLTSNLGSLHQSASIPPLVYTLSALADGEASKGSVLPTGGWSQVAMRASEALTPFTGGGSAVSPAALMSFTPLGILGSLFSNSEPAVIPQSHRRENIAGLIAEPRSIGIDEQASFGYAIDRSSTGAPRMVSESQTRVPTQITVNVQTIDSRSFLDHSEDIAQALRRSLLSDNPLREVL